MRHPLYLPPGKFSAPAARKQLFWEEIEQDTNRTVKRLVEEGLEIERDAYLGLKTHQRAKERQDYRNGYYVRTLLLAHGVIPDLQVPRTRSGNFQSDLLPRYSRHAEAFDREVQELVLSGASMRKVRRFLKKLLGGVTVSAMTVSRIWQKLRSEMAAFQQRPLEDRYAFLYLDGFSVTIRRAFRRPPVAVVALGGTAQGQAEILGFRIAPSESSDACGRLLQDLFNRGLTGKNLQMVIQDGAGGWKEALTFVYPTTPFQSCTVHKVRGLLKYLRSPFQHRALLADAAGCFNAPNLFVAKARLREFIRKWQLLEPKAVARFCSGLEACFTFYRFPAELHPRIRSTNLLERFLEEWRRRLKTIRSFADETSCELLLFSIAQLFNQDQAEKCPKR
jgi:putative transposase